MELPGVLLVVCVEEWLDFIVFMVKLKLLFSHVGVPATEFLIPLISIPLPLSDLTNAFGKLFLILTKIFLFISQLRGLAVMIVARIIVCPIVLMN